MEMIGREYLSGPVTRPCCEAIDFVEYGICLVRLVPSWNFASLCMVFFFIPAKICFHNVPSWRVVTRTSGNPVVSYSSFALWRDGFRAVMAVEFMDSSFDDSTWGRSFRALVGRLVLGSVSVLLDVSVGIWEDNGTWSGVLFSFLFATLEGLRQGSERYLAL
ncbi:hypothetical protein A2U01_0014925 [Trifolium medium]|uniref:Uncharacterized protein n=1 Tax=Trifolium medium TaxID=97028 RepID=A0A392N2L9_9FABA|nr:hypothetical protein [Trifolium medium]